MFDINNEKIDLVYAWVDGSDEEWINKRNYYAKMENAGAESIEKGRFSDNDELKFSLRSVEKYASWINKIYIVTDNQIPIWLNTRHPKIQIIDHKDIIPAKYLPTFNSIAIDHCIVNIPDLSEYFLYSCDDMFFVRKVEPDFFYIRGDKPIYRFNKHYNKAGIGQYNDIIKYTDELVKNKFGFYKARFSHHNIDPYKKSNVKECQEFFKNEIEKSIASKFRKAYNVERQLYALVAIYLGSGVYKEVRMIDKWLPLCKKIYNKLNNIYQIDSLYMPMYETNYEKVMIRNNPILLCLNDGGYTTDSDRKRAKLFLNYLYPEKSTFEI